MRNMFVKITTLLITKRYVLVSSYFYICISYLLDFDMDNVILFYTQYF